MIRSSHVPRRSAPSEATFRCPLYRSCLEPEAPSYPSIDALNAAVAEYRSCSAATRDERARRIFARCLRLVRRELMRFCPLSQCRPGACLPEELIGATYMLFVQALDDYRADSGIDFLGYATRRLWWGLRHEARHLRNPLATPPRHEDRDHLSRHGCEEARILDRVYAAELLARLGDEDAELLILRFANGYLHRELAEMTGLSHAAVRKRIERLYLRLREWAAEG